MPRFARPHVTGGLFHVISRFHNRSFFLDIDGARARYLYFLGEASKKHDCRVLAYCLMSSHVHLVLQLGTLPLGNFTRSVHSGWALWLNRKKKGLGTILADRPQSVLVHSETYGLELIRYVHNNPVRAGIVESASQSGWSSHRAYLGLDEVPTWLDVEPVLGAEGSGREALGREFAVFVEEGRGEPRRPEFSGEVSHALAKEIRRAIGGPVEISYPVLGPDEFVMQAYRNQAEKNNLRRSLVDSGLSALDVVVSLCEETNTAESLMRSRSQVYEAVRARALVAWIWCERFQRPQVDVAKVLNQRPSAVSKALGSLRQKGLSEPDAALVERIVERVTVPADGENDAVRPLDVNGKRCVPKVLVLHRKRNGSG